MVNKPFTSAKPPSETRGTAKPAASFWGQFMCRIALFAFGALLCASAPAQAELLVNISKSQQRLSVTIDGTEAYRWPISSGRRGYDTPSGNFRPHRLERHWYSRQYEMTPMPWAVFFHRGYAVHATMEAYNLGRVASHGCVRLRPDNAAILYSLVRKQGLGNTKLVVMNGPLPALPGALPMVEAPDDAMDHFASAPSDDTAEFAAKSVVALPELDDEPLLPIRISDVEKYRVSVGSDDKVLRERQAWLRALNFKYGVAR